MFAPLILFPHKITMGQEIHRETMQKGHEASIGFFQGKSYLVVPADPRCFNGYTSEQKHANGRKQANADSETEGAVNSEKLAVPNECYYFLSAFYPNLLKEMHGQLHPANNGQYFPTYWFIPQGPLQMLPQSYIPSECALQDFDYFVVIDFEATCDREKNPHPQEIIEFPSVLVNTRTGQLEDCFQKYVKPTYNKQLTDFCKDLTGILQSQVDEGASLSEALLMHDKWLEDKGIAHTNFAIVTWSNWDCRVMLESECRFKKIKKPPYFNRWINLKVPFCEVFGGVRCNLKKAVEWAGLTWEGRAHCGLDDAKNTARLLAHLMHLGFKFSITSSLLRQSADHPYIMQPSPPEYGLPYEAHKWKNAPCFNLIPFQPTQITNPVKEAAQVRCYCGVTSIKFRKPGPKHGSFYFGCGNWTANRGALCAFSKWAPAYDSAETC